MLENYYDEGREKGGKINWKLVIAHWVIALPFNTITLIEYVYNFNKYNFYYSRYL